MYVWFKITISFLSTRTQNLNTKSFSYFVWCEGVCRNNILVEFMLKFFLNWKFVSLQFPNIFKYCFHFYWIRAMWCVSGTTNAIVFFIFFVCLIFQFNNNKNRKISQHIIECSVEMWNKKIEFVFPLVLLVWK